MYCVKCGINIGESTTYCPACGAKTDIGATLTYVSSRSKSRSIAVLLALFCGCFGMHNFYLGYTLRGLSQLLLSTLGILILIGPLIAAGWAFVDALQLLTKVVQVDAKGVLLKG